uniref:CRAL-TRIO domain-containing protein n=1 Tax=Strongyloides venezuelensis TaxID=75913 RepID=A0A0K0F1X9_STRVS
MHPRDNSHRNNKNDKKRMENPFFVAKNQCFQNFINSSGRMTSSYYQTQVEDDCTGYCRENDTSIFQLPTSITKSIEDSDDHCKLTYHTPREYIQQKHIRPSKIDLDYYNGPTKNEKSSVKKGGLSNYDLSFDLTIFKNTLGQASFLDDSGYKSTANDKSFYMSPDSRNKNSLLTSSYYGTGWLLAESLTPEDENNSNDWEAQMTVGRQKIQVSEVGEILNTNYAFISGASTREGHPILTFPDARSQITFEQYHLLITYLFQVPLVEDTQKGLVLIIDRRNDKWSSLRILFSYLMNYFPEPIRLIFLLKPEGVFQRALEVGYRNFFDSTKYKVVICQSVTELGEYIGPERLTMDVGGELKYNHKEWIDHRMDIERMKSSASVIAESLSNFAKCLRETELPNDVDTTERILQIQSGDRDAIKEDFRIAIRKGMSLLRHIRQAEEKPHGDDLSPTRYHNVTAVERMLVQLEETERSFDTFWEKHRQRLTNCLQQRKFEERFRKLQSNFAKHMIYLEEHREVGDSVERAEVLADEHKEYVQMAKEDVEIAHVLRKDGDELINNHSQDNQLSGSLLPKCDELTRMAEALQSALNRRAEVLQLSMTMHRQIAEANKWCKAGVQLLSNIPIDINPTTIASTISKMDEFLMEGSKLQLEPFNAKQTMNSLILLTTTETSTLLAQVAERIDDIRRMGVARRDALLKYSERELKKPVQVVSPEKSLPTTPAKEYNMFDGDNKISSEVRLCHKKLKLYFSSNFYIFLNLILKIFMHNDL